MKRPIATLLLSALVFLGCDTASQTGTPSQTYKEWSGIYEGASDGDYYDENGKFDSSVEDQGTDLDIDLRTSENGSIALMVESRSADVAVGGDGVVDYLSSDSLFADEQNENIKTEFELTKNGDEVSGRAELFKIDSGGVATIQEVYEFTLTLDQD